MLILYAIVTVAASALAQTNTKLAEATVTYSGDGHSLPDAPSAASANLRSDGEVHSRSAQAIPHWSPLTTGQKFDRFLASTYSPSTVFITSIWAHSSELQPFSQEPMRGLSHRYAISYADAQSSAFIQNFLLPSIMGQDPRYFRESAGSTQHRFGYAISRILITRNDRGENVFNTSGLAGAFLSSAVHNAYHPYYNRGVDGTVNRALGNLATRAAMNVLREFWPDLRGRSKGKLNRLMSIYQP